MKVKKLKPNILQLFNNNPKLNSLYTTTLIFFYFLLLISESVSKRTVFPDFYSVGDKVYLSDKLEQGVQETLIYHLGVYGMSGSVKSHTHNLKYEGDNSCEIYSLSLPRGSGAVSFFTDQISSTDTKDIEDNKLFSEELNIIKYACYAERLRVKAPVGVIHNPGYIFHYKVLLGVSGTKTIKIRLIATNLTGGKDICSFSHTNMGYFHLTIKSKITETNKVQMFFMCDKSKTEIDYMSDLNENFYFEFSSSSTVYVSMYQVTLEDTINSYYTGEKKNNYINFIRTENGLGVCSSSIKCVKGYTCVSGECKRCNAKCFTCADGNPNTCTECNTLTNAERSASSCQINHVDLKDFKDLYVDVPVECKEFHERSTMGVWVFISELTLARGGKKNIYHVALKDRYVISIAPNENTVDLFCHAYEDLYRLVTTETTLYSNYKDKKGDYVIAQTIPTSKQSTYIQRKDLSAQWFHVTCGLSFDHKKFYLGSMINGERYSIEKTLRKENLYYDSDTDTYIENDVYYRHIVLPKDKLRLEFRNFGGSGSKIFLKYFLLFQEYIPKEYEFMYSDFSSSTENLILYKIPFDLLLDDNKIYGYDYSGTEYTHQFIVVDNEIKDLFPPLNFKPLRLPKYDKKYVRTTLRYTADLDSITGSGTLNWDDGSPLFCANYLFTKTDQCINSVPYFYENRYYITFPWYTKTKGYLDNGCTPDMKCDPNLFPDYCNPKYEEEEEIIYNMYYSCENIQTTYYLQYSSFYNPAPFGLGGFGLDSYIVEMWYYPDFFLSDSNRENQFLEQSSIKNYVFFSNIGQAFFFYHDYKHLRVEDTHHTFIVENYHPFEWNKLVWHGMLKEGKIYKNFYINNLIDDPIYFGYVKQGDLGARTFGGLSFFEHYRYADGEGESDYYFRWASGYYKNIRIWNGDSANFPLTVQYDNFFNNTKGRVESIQGYYPLSNRFIANNKFKEITGRSNGGFLRGIDPGDYNLRRFNFGSKFDFIRSKYPFLGHYLQADSEAPKPSQCAQGCLRCWNAGANCYECSQGYILTLTRECRAVKNYYFRSPCVNKTDSCNATFPLPNDGINAVTVTFWLKTIGFNNEQRNSLGEVQNFTIFEYSKFTKLIFSKIEGVGLILKDEKTNKIISQDVNFREKIGRWAFISLAYYKEQKEGGKIIFPKMVQFEVNDENMTIINRNEVFFEYFRIRSEFYGLVFNVRYYYKYILGAYGFATNNGDLISPFSNPTPEKTYLVPGDSVSSCKNDLPTKKDVANYVCVPDYDVLFDSFPDTYDKYIKYDKGYAQPIFCDFLWANSEKTISRCHNACKGTNTFYDCSCLNQNFNSQLIIRHKEGTKNVDYCRSFNYINFANAKPIHVPDIQTAKETKKFTMQFWILIYNFDVDTRTNFEEVVFHWYMHLKITIKREGTQYKVYCTTWAGASGVEQTKEGRLSVVQEWNYVSCAVSFPSQLFYLLTGTHWEKTTENKTPSLIYSTPNNYIATNTKTYLDIQNNFSLTDWGYLFYTQIHLWKDFYSNPDFLLRLTIKTKSKFPYLLHSWDPIFVGYKGLRFDENFIVHDLPGTNAAPDFNVEYIGSLGFNVMEESAYNEKNAIILCSEDGQYYDTYLKKCLQFSDLSQLNDFTFTNVPKSYSGSYSMAFWLFFEDASLVADGLHFRWENHMQITVHQNGYLEGVCFPQGYYADYLSNDDIAAKISQLRNVARIKLTADNLESGVWIFVLCSVSNYVEEYFLRGNGATDLKNMIPEILYESDTTGTVLNRYPYHYFTSDVQEGLPKPSKLFLENLKSERKIYIRELFLFKDYIPTWYADAFKNTDLTQISDKKMLQSMVFVCNFADFNLISMTLAYYIINEENEGNGKEPVFTKIRKTVRLTSQESASFELSANFAFIGIFPPVELSGDIYYYSRDLGEVPIVCKNGLYIKYNSGTGKLSCESSCSSNLVRIPGTPQYSGICNIPCKTDQCPQTYARLSDYKTYSKCNTGKIRLDYKCLPNSLDVNSGFYYSRCYNQPNFYHRLSNDSKNKFSSGYYLEFWFKIDKVQPLKFCTTTADKEYFFYSTPHSLYKDLTDNKYYYRVIDSVYYSQVDGISEYEWNKIVIKTTLGTSLGQNVYFYINFDIDNIKATIKGIPSSIPMQLDFISFCSKESNGDCTIAGPATITWASAYYRNIRLWELYTSTIYSIQDYNIQIFEEPLFSLKLNYPLTASYMDVNKLSQIQETSLTSDYLDSIQIVHEESYNFNSMDDYSFFNWATNFDWGVEKPENKEYFISTMDGYVLTTQHCGRCCERCYTTATTNCYKCTSECVLKGMTCVPIDGYYLKIPGETGGIVKLKIPDYSTKYGLTFTFYMKFEGVKLHTPDTSTTIMKFSDSVYLNYNKDTSYLEFYINDEIAFQYTKFYEIIGQWIPYSIAIYASNVNDIYPHMFTFSVNKQDIPFTGTFTLPNDLSQMESITFGRYIVALFVDFRFYDNFIQGGFAKAKSEDSFIFQFPFRGTSKTNCWDPTQLDPDSSEPKCVADYTEYMEKSCRLPETEFFDLSLLNLGTPCEICPDYCKTKCFFRSNTQCTCDMTDGLYWLRRSKKTKETYCEYIPFIDYSVLEDITMIVPASHNFESTLEFWIFIYSYNTEHYKFNGIELSWDLHNKVVIINQENTLLANCYAIVDFSNPGRPTKSMSLSISGFEWVHLNCGSDFISVTKKYYLNSQEEEITLVLDEHERPEAVEFTIKNFGNPASFGFVFLREIKLWQQYNFKYIDTSYMDLIKTFGVYDLSQNKSSGIFPGLLAYVRSEYKQEDYLDAKDNEKYYVINELGSDEPGSRYTKTYEVNRRSDYLGYNIIDPNNYGYYSDLLLCNEGYIYDAANNICNEVKISKCQYPSDLNDKCVTCPEENIYIYPPTGDCVRQCGERYYARDDMNECRACHVTCYYCGGWRYNNCHNCTDDLFFVPPLNICIPYCQEYEMTESKNVSNLCVEFDCTVNLTNYEEEVPIDINTFHYLIAEITYINTKTKRVEWEFDPETTKAINGDPPDYEFPLNMSTPFDDPSTIDNLNVTVNNSFFELRKRYRFLIHVISYNVKNESLMVSKTFGWTLLMNSPPDDGYIDMVPNIGLNNLTVFFIRCLGWTDDTARQDEFTYSFFYHERGTGYNVSLRGWSYNNELITSFNVEQEDNVQNEIDIYCRVRDNYLAESETNFTVTVVTELSSNIYTTGKVLDSYHGIEGTISKVQLYYLSEVLRSFGLNKQELPATYQTKYRPADDLNSVINIDPAVFPELDASLCNGRGKVYLVDEFLVCRCNKEYVGTNCHIEEEYSYNLTLAYKELFWKLMGTLQEEIIYEEFMVMYNLFYAAEFFVPETSFFYDQLETFITMVMTNYKPCIYNFTYEYFDFFNFYYNLELDRLNKFRAEKMIIANTDKRNITIDEEQQEEFKTAFDYIHSKLMSVIDLITSKYVNRQIAYSYENSNFYLQVISVNPIFEENKFFKERRENYHTVPKFMTCLNYIEINTLSNPYFQTFMIYIEYLNFPFGYNETIYVNNTSPLIEIKFIDATNGKNFDLVDCLGAESINIDMPFTNYRSLDIINKQRFLFDPRNYKSPDDPIFSDPIYINKSGYVSNDTVEQRIEKYHRKNNLSCRYFDEEKNKFVDDGVVYTNYTSDTNYIQFNTSHLSRFTVFMVLNNATFKVSGRFYYLSRPELLKWPGNYKKNYGFLIFVIVTAIYVSGSLILGCFDSLFSAKESLLETLKREIIKSFLPYRSKKEKERDAKKMVPIGISPHLLGDEKERAANTRYFLEKDKDKETINLGEEEEKPKVVKFSLKKSTESEDRLKETMDPNQIKSKKQKISGGGGTTVSRKQKGGYGNENGGVFGDDEIREEEENNRIIQEFYKANFGEMAREEMNPNHMGQKKEKANAEYKRKLNAYANLNLSFGQFLGQNLLGRNILLNPFINPSMFSPRWKKLVLFATNINIETLMMAIFLTDDENVTHETLPSLIKCSFCSVLIADFMAHLLAVFFQVTENQKKHLLKLVLTKGQLIVIREYESIICLNGIFSAFGMFLCFIIWIGSLYVTFTFNSVWKVQEIAFLYSIIICFGIDYILLDCFYELFLAVIYLGRKNSSFLRRVGEFLNRVRNYRCLTK